MDNDEYIRKSLVMVIYDPDGWVSAFANINLEYQRNEATIDLMRHRQNAENGIMEFLFVSLFFWARSRGYESFNLGLSSLSGVGEQPGDPAVERAMHYVYEHINQFYSFRGLHKFNEKFNPSWSPRYLIYPGPGNLLPTALAMVEADSGGNPIRSYINRK